MLKNVVLDSREIVPFTFYYSVIFLSDGVCDVMSWVPLQTPYIKNYSNGDNVEVVRSARLNRDYASDLPLMPLGITMKPKNSNFTFTGRYSFNEAQREVHSILTAHGQNYFQRHLELTRAMMFSRQ